MEIYMKRKVVGGGWQARALGAPRARLGHNCDFYRDVSTGAVSGFTHNTLPSTRAG